MKNLKRVCVLGISGLVILGTVSFAKTGIVNAPSGLVLRKEASKGAEPIATVDDKSKVEIIEKDGEWYKVKYSGNEGYLFAEFVNEQEVKNEEETEKATEEKIEENVEEKKEQKTEENKKEKSSKKQAVKYDLKIYTIPSVTAKTIGSVKKGEEVTINYELNNWVNITYGKTEGWARKYFVDGKIAETKQDVEKADEKEENKVEEKKEEKVEEKTEVKQETKSAQENIENQEGKILENKKGYVYAENSVNIRKEANTSADIIDTLLGNTEVNVVGVEGDFYKIEYQNIKGYISKSFVTYKPMQ